MGLAVPVSDLHFKEFPSVCGRDTCAPVFTAALFVIAELWISFDAHQ